MLRRQLIVGLAMTAVMIVLTGILYPLAVTGASQVLFPHRADGSLVTRSDREGASAWVVPKMGTRYVSADVRVIAQSTLSVFWREHADAEQQLRAWYHEAEAADWPTTSDIQRDFPRASILKGGHVVFDICGNRY